MGSGSLHHPLIQKADGAGAWDGEDRHMVGLYGMAHSMSIVVIRWDTSVTIVGWMVDGVTHPAQHSRGGGGCMIVSRTTNVVMGRIES